MKQSALLAMIVLCAAGPSKGDEPQILKRNPDPYGYPRPAPAATHVPVGTSFFIQLGFQDKNSSDAVLADSVVVRLRGSDLEEAELLSSGASFADGYTGSIAPSRKPPSALAINIDGGPALRPGTTYTVSVQAKSRSGGVLSADKGSWQFTTADNENSHKLHFDFDPSDKPVIWQGGFFTGFCKPSFCTSASNRISGYELMQSIRRDSPRAWSLQRDFSPTSTGHQPEFLDWSHPNVVRERETRRIVSIEPQDAGVVLRVEDFFGHQQYGIPSNRALASDYHAGDARLDGRRSRRVEDLCRAHDGQGSPCDFVSVHSYNAAPLTAAKLRRAKELALEVDADYFANLWVNSFESCPDWAPPPDAAAADSYLGNGYFSTWCADVTRRRLATAAEDPRYGFGETILTFWPWPNSNFRGHNNATQVLGVDDDGDGRKDRDETVALPILRFLGLLARMGDHYCVLPEQVIGGHVVSGFASRDDDTLFILVYSHDPSDVQARSQAEFLVALQFKGVTWAEASVREYQFDKDHNSYFHLGCELRDRTPSAPNVRRPNAEQVAQLLAGFADNDPAVQLAAVKDAATYDELPESIAGAAFQLHQSTKDEMIRATIEEAGKRIMTRKSGFDPEQVARVKELSQLHVTRKSQIHADGTGRVRLTIPVAANGANFVVIKKRHAD